MASEGFEVGEIVDRRTKGGRVEYYIKWIGYDDSENTWETRMNLIKDGHAALIRSFERARKSSMNGTSSGSDTGSKKSRSRSNSTKKSARASRSRSVKSRTSPSPSPARPDKSSSSTSPKSKKSTVKKSTKLSKSPRNSYSKLSEDEKSSAKETEDDEESETADEADISSSKKPKRYNAVSDMIGSALADGWFSRSVGFFIVILAMLANVLIPEIQKNSSISASPQMHMALLMMKKTTALPSLICLALILRSKDKRIYAKWIGICLVWRTTGEVLLQLPDSLDLYTTVALAAFGAADFAVLVAVCSILGGLKPSGDVLTQTLGAMGSLGLIASDIILVLLQESKIYADRFLVMSLSLVLISVSALIQERP